MKLLTKQRIENTFKKLEENPKLMDIPISNLNQFKENKSLHEKYIQQWEIILKLPIKEIKDLMLKDDDLGEILRSTSIFIRIP